MKKSRNSHRKRCHSQKEIRRELQSIPKGVTFLPGQPSSWVVSEPVIDLTRGHSLRGAKLFAPGAAVLCALPNFCLMWRAAIFLMQFTLFWGICCPIVLIISLKFSSSSNIGVFQGSVGFCKNLQKFLWLCDLFPSGSPSSNLITTVKPECWSITHL